MKNVSIKKVQQPLSGELSFPGDKSLSHRAIIFGSLAKGDSSFTNVLSGEDCVCTRQAFESMGVEILTRSATELLIRGKGRGALKRPSKEIYLGNSGTSMRLLLGVLAGQPFEATLTGDPSLSQRPMRRVTDPLRKMGAFIDGRENANYAPLKIQGAVLKGMDARLDVSSAQVKSAILLAGLYAQGTTRVTEPVKSRDHTERFLKFFGAKLKEEGSSVWLEGPQELSGRTFEIAGDISSAAFFMAAALLVPNGALRFRRVLWNSTRNGMAEVLKRMGVSLKPSVSELGPEPTADFSLHAQKLKAFEIQKEELPSLIDEIPILAVLATQAEGISIIHDASELRVKETDRIHSMTSSLRQMGANIRSDGDTLIIKGSTPLRGTKLSSFKDHRTAMSLAIAGLIAEGETRIEDVDCINTSFPNFFELLTQLGVLCESTVSN